MISEYENTLRRLIISIIGSDDSSPYNISDERIKIWKEKREIEVKKNKGISLEKRLIYYSDLYDLRTIISKNWELFLPILLNKKRFEVFFSEIETFRNTISHGRNLIASQEYLLKGITSDLKNLITIYHNRNEMKEDYFIQILKINDNLGNIWENNLDNNNPILRVGDDYELTIEANDPKDREIEYEIFTLNNFKIKQKSNHFNFKIEKELVSKGISLYILARTPKSDYINEAVMSILLTVLPK